MTREHQKSDVIIAFGAAVREGGRPSPAMVRRVAHAIDLMNSGVAGHLLLTGGKGRHPPAEAELMAGLAAAQGISRDCMTLEAESGSTLENVKFSLEIMKKRGWTTAVVVSDPYHIFRIRFTFRRLGLDVATSPAPGAKQANTRRQWWRFVLREAAAMVYHAVKLM